MVSYQSQSKHNVYRRRDNEGREREQMIQGTVGAKFWIWSGNCLKAVWIHPQLGQSALI